MLKKQIWTHKSTRVGLIIVTITFVSAIFAPWLAPCDPVDDFDNWKLLTPPGKEFLLGSDYLGRDQLSRLLYGARVSLGVGFSVMAASIIVGTVLGLLSGYYGRKIDEIVNLFINITLAFPPLLLAIAAMAALGPGLTNVIVALSLVSWPSIARLVRGEVLKLKNKDFVVAARALGVKDIAILFKHILPNCVAPILVAGTLGIATAILNESALSFLGLGVQPPHPSWGAMLGRGRDYIWIAPWLTTIPGLAILITILGMNLLGDGLRDILDPRMKNRS